MSFISHIEQNTLNVQNPINKKQKMPVVFISFVAFLKIGFEDLVDFCDFCVTAHQLNANVFQKSTRSPDLLATGLFSLKTAFKGLLKNVLPTL